MKKTSNGWSMVGICGQWAIDEGLKPNELVVYMTIIRNSFGYKKRWCYADYGLFTISNRNTIKKTIEILKDKGVLSVSWTFKDNGHRNKNKYTILQPSKYIRNFEFIAEQEDDTPDWLKE